MERQVLIVRDHVLAGRTFASLDELDAAFHAWLPIRRAQLHRTHGQVIANRAIADRAALQPLPGAGYPVVDRHLRRVGKDCLVSFESSRYSIPATRVTAGMTVELRVGPDRVAIHATGHEPALLAEHRRPAAAARTDRSGALARPARRQHPPHQHSQRRTCRRSRGRRRPCGPNRRVGAARAHRPRDPRRAP